MAVQYQGPYSPAVYRAANQIQSGTVNQSYPAPIWQTAQQLAGVSQPQKGAVSQPQGQVLGTSTGPSAPTGRREELAAIAAKGDLNPAQRTEWEQMQQAELASQISELYEPYKAELDSIEGRLREESTADQGLIDQQFALNERLTKDNEAELIGSADREEAKYNKVLDSAFEQAIRDYNALQQQGFSRFGGGSSAGRAVGELAQREYFRNQGKVADTRAQGAQEFALERTRISKYVKDKLEQLNLAKTEATNELKKTLALRLDDIRARKYDLEANKTRDRMAILQDTINQARQMRDRDQQFRQSLGIAAVEKMQEIEGRVFTPQEISTTLAEFGINLPVGSSAPQTFSRTVAKRPGQDDEFQGLF